MIIRFKDYKGITIPNELLVSEGSFGSSTPYTARIAANLKKRAYREFRLPAKLTCLEHIANSMSGIKSYSDVMAGVGLSVRVLGKGQLALNDNDESCRRVLDLNFEVGATNDDVFTKPYAASDAIFLDFNNFTYVRSHTTHKAPLDEAFRRARKYVILNDCSVFYFRYGVKAYDNYTKRLAYLIRSVPDYFKAVKNVYKAAYPGWYLTEANYFRDSSFLLFSKRDKGLTIREVTPNTIGANDLTIWES